MSIDFLKKSSAVTLSDMEIFVFPELMYSLVLANIMSPCIWEWKNDPWFDKYDKQSPYKRILRLKQYIMNRYVFNLDLETWGLTTQEKELARFNPFVDTELLRQSNALFGYTGDSYYFDVDIRRHFGLDAYTSNVIPYWKTETVEAMNAFRRKPHYETGAGECVSLAALYTAALFIVANIPLEDIFMMATPLHSQNFILVRDGILTNNRRIVTKNMWINGTELSAKARRALENERVTIVSHISGHIHTLYPEASIDAARYSTFAEALNAFVKTELTPQILGNFLRYRSDLHRCFQIHWHMHGHDYYIEAEKIYAYETNSPHLFTSANRKHFMSNIDVDEFHVNKIPKRIVLNDLEDYIHAQPIDLHNADHVFALRKEFETDCMNAVTAIESLISFCCITPQLPAKKEKKERTYGHPLTLTPGMDRKKVIEHLHSIRHNNPMADLAFYAYRDLHCTDPAPFIAAALERNPVCIDETKNLSLQEVITRLQQFAPESIYPGHHRIAQPDEVWNFGCGDGIEKALALANILLYRNTDEKVHMSITPDMATIRWANNTLSFPSTKQLSHQEWDMHTMRTHTERYV